MKIAGKQPLITVIIPVYNVEKYLDRCVNSIVNQTYKNLEIILVDDGSTDKSGLMCNEWKKKDERIKVIHKENGGLSDARNCALDSMHGDFVYFVDSDDFLDKECIKKLFSVMVDTDSDIVACEVLDIKEDTADCSQFSDVGNDVEVMNNIEACLRLKTSSKVNIGVVVWNKLYRKWLWENVRFPVGKIHEDEAVIYQVVYPARKIAYLHETLHFYRINDESIMHQRFRKKNLDILYALKNRIDYLKGKNEKLVDVNRKTYLHFLAYYGYMAKRYKIVNTKDLKAIKKERNKVFAEIEKKNFRCYVMRFLPSLYGIIVMLKGRFHNGV